MNRAPELSCYYKDERVIDSSKADVWSLGVLAYAVSEIEENISHSLLEKKQIQMN